MRSEIQPDKLGSSWIPPAYYLPGQAYQVRYDTGKKGLKFGIQVYFHSQIRMASPAEKNRKLTYGDYLEWTDKERWELINGEALNITPTPSRRHQGVLMALASEFYNFLEDKSCEVYVAPFDVRLPEADQPEKDITTVVQPDLTVVCDLTKLDDKGCLGTPDLIVEIISPPPPPVITSKNSPSTNAGWCRSTGSSIRSIKRLWCFS